jgi:hypothetical protein
VDFVDFSSDFVEFFIDFFQAKKYIFELLGPSSFFLKFKIFKKKSVVFETVTQREREILANFAEIRSRFKSMITTHICGNCLASVQTTSRI